MEAPEKTKVDMSKTMDQLFSDVQEHVYTSCYCEENVWHLCKHVQDRHPGQTENCFCIFISNALRMIPLWCQKASSQPDGCVVWDYHVIFVYRSQSGSLVYDFDSMKVFPCDFTTYSAEAIRPCDNLNPQYHRQFRVIPAEVFLEKFASDRTHMLAEDGSWLKPPPSYPCIQTSENTNNIQDFISMDQDYSVGTVLNFTELCNFFSTQDAR